MYRSQCGNCRNSANRKFGFVVELVWNGGAERIWAIEPASEAPPEARVPTGDEGDA